jgi:agmatinase
MDQQVENFIRELLSSESSMLSPRYSGIPTFMRTPPGKDLSEIEIALVGVPFDGGVTNRAGARHGPREIRNQSTFQGFQNHQSKIIPFQLCRVADVGDVPIPDRYTLDSAIAAIEDFYRRLVRAGVVPVSAGGDHSISYPILKAVGEDTPVGLVHVDAHCDTMPEFEGSKFHHGGPFRNAVEAGVLDPRRTIQIGIRGPAEPFWEFSYETGMRVIHIEQFYQLGLKQVMAEIRQVVGTGPTYVSFDLDGLDPAYAGGTGTPEIGGLSTFEAQQLVRSLEGLNLVGGDVVEVAPPFDPSGNTALVGATMMFEILCVVAEATARRRNAQR